MVAGRFSRVWDRSEGYTALVVGNRTLRMLAHVEKPGKNGERLRAGNILHGGDFS